jgi:hypothetical protein
MAWRLSAHDVCRLKALGALEQIKLHGLSFIERAIAVLLNGGEMHEDILSRGALDKPVSLRPVEPLDSSFLSHGKTPFALVAMKLFSRLQTDTPRTVRGNPLGNSGEPDCANLLVWIWLRFVCAEKVLPKEKDSSVRRHGFASRRELTEPDNWCFSATQLNVNLPCWSHGRTVGPVMSKR